MRRIATAALTAVLMGFLISAITPAAASAQSSASKQDKTQACKDTADKRNLTGDDRKNFMQSCLNKTGVTQQSGSQQNNSEQSNAQQTVNDKLDDASQKNRLNTCENLADKKNLKGRDRRSYVKDCMQKANPK